MINRTYFYSVESIPVLRKSRRKNKKVTFASGTVDVRSFFPTDSVKLIDSILRRSENKKMSFFLHEIVITQLSRLS